MGQLACFGHGVGLSCWSKVKVEGVYIEDYRQDARRAHYSGFDPGHLSFPHEFMIDFHIV